MSLIGPLSDPVFLLALLSFLPSLVVLGYYFSSVIGARPGKRNGLNRQGLVTSFSGLSITTAFSLVGTAMPDNVPFMDVAVIAAAIAWTALLRHYCGTGWLESLPQVILAAVVYVVILAAASAFSLLLLG